MERNIYHSNLAHLYLKSNWHLYHSHQQGAKNKGLQWIIKKYSLKTKPEQKILTSWNENCSVHLDSFFSFYILSWDSLLSQLKLSRLVRSIYMSLFCSSFHVVDDVEKSFGYMHDLHFNFTWISVSVLYHLCWWE